MNHMMLIARSAGRVCARYIAQLLLTLKALGSIPLIRSKRHAALTSTYSDVLGGSGTLQARAHQGLTPSRLRVARGVAIAIGIALSIVPSPISNGSIGPIQSLKELADYHLTEKQEYCHNRITFLESSDRRDANNGSHWGYYQGRSIALKNAPDDYQFNWYWYYVSHRYGVTQYDEPNYCNALHHLRVKGWQ